jgi:iron complex outermembrane receptor protein
MSMTSSIARSVCLLIAFTAGCASHGTNTQPAPKPMVTSDDLTKNTGEPIEQVLQAKVPGLVVTRTADGGVAVYIRGSSSFYSGNQPLYVMDEVPFNPGPGGALLGVNPYDIESIRVLKDPADTGLYGMRGANGVIVITMKKPPKRPG